MFLIVSNKDDLATDYLILRLHERKIPFLRVNTEDYLSSWHACFSIGNDGYNAEIYIGESSPVPVGIFSGAYIRQPKMPPLNIQKEDLDFAEREVGESLKSLWRMIHENVWLNAPYRILRASNKAEQLVIATLMGFKIPETYIGTNPKKLSSFYRKCSGEMIAKAVKHGFNFDGDRARVAATQKIDEKTMCSLEDYATIPMIFQKQISKMYDVRVTVVGDIVFSTAIRSQDYEETAVDWRLSDCYKIALRQDKINLPESIKSMCVGITKKFNLRYSAIDLILGKDGTYYFLELNPNGQWAWLEQLGIHEIRDAIIDELLSGKIES